MPLTYDQLLEGVFERHPSVGVKGFSSDSYKPGLDNMLRFDRALGIPSEQLRCVHIAGTNGKGSVSSMIASGLSAGGLKVGLYTSPHLLDFRERIKIVGGDLFTMVPRDYVYDFLSGNDGLFEGLSFFEITTGLAFKWFADSGVDIAVIETGLGGRLDSTNIIVPELSVITSIGLDHCAQLGGTLRSIASEKAGIFKSGVPALVWDRTAETEKVFEDTVARVHCPLFFACDFEVPRPGEMDLKGAYQAVNVRTALAALELLGAPAPLSAIEHAAARTGLRGRWELLHRSPDVICDIGHNPQALEWNFAQLEAMVWGGRRPGSAQTGGGYSNLTVVFGAMADKDFASAAKLFPSGARVLFATPHTPRAKASAELLEEFRALRPEINAEDAGDVAAALREALSLSGPSDLVFVGGSAYVVAEALQYF